MKKNNKTKNIKLLIASILCSLTFTAISVSVSATQRTPDPKNSLQDSSSKEKIEIYDELTDNKKRIMELEEVLKNELNESDDIDSQELLEQEKEIEELKKQINKFDEEHKDLKNLSADEVINDINESLKEGYKNFELKAQEIQKRNLEELKKHSEKVDKDFEELNKEIKEELYKIFIKDNYVEDEKDFNQNDENENYVEDEKDFNQNDEKDNYVEDEKENNLENENENNLEDEKENNLENENENNIKFPNPKNKIICEIKEVEEENDDEDDLKKENKIDEIKKEKTERPNITRRIRRFNIDKTEEKNIQNKTIDEDREELKNIETTLRNYTETLNTIENLKKLDYESTKQLLDELNKNLQQEKNKIKNTRIERSFENIEEKIKNLNSKLYEIKNDNLEKKKKKQKYQIIT